MKYTLRLQIAKTSLELIRRAVLLDPAIRFGNQFNLDQISAALGCTPNSLVESDVIYNQALVLMAFLWQMLSTNEMRSCVAAVKQIAHYYAVTQKRIVSTNTGAYCRARAHLPVEGIRRLNRQVTSECEDQVPAEWQWEIRALRDRADHHLGKHRSAAGQYDRKKGCLLTMALAASLIKYRERVAAPDTD